MNNAMHRPCYICQNDAPASVKGAQDELQKACNSTLTRGGKRKTKNRRSKRKTRKLK